MRSESEIVEETTQFKLLGLQAELEKLKADDQTLMQQKDQWDQHKLGNQQAQEHISQQIQTLKLGSFNSVIANLRKQIIQLRAQKQSPRSTASFDWNGDQVANALNEFCDRITTRAGSLIALDELEKTAQLVEDTLKIATQSPTISTINALKEKFNQIEEKARDLEGSKHIFKRKLAKALLGVGIVLALGAAVTLILSFTPVMLPVLVTAGFGAMFGINVAVTISLVVGAAMTKINFDRLRSSSLSTTMPLLSQSLFKLRDTIKDVTEGRDPKDVSWVRQIARSNR